MHQLYYPGMSSPSKIGMKMAACSPPKAVRKNESVRRKIAVGSVASVEAATAAPAGGSAEQSTTMTGIHPSEWPTLDFPHPVQPLALSSSSQAQAVLDSTPLQGKRHKKAESAQRGSSSTKHRDSATPAAAAAASVDTSGHRSIVGPAARTLVAVRLRPPNDSEREQQQFESCVAVDPAQKSVDVSRSFLNKKQYLFDAVFNESADTQEIYNSLIRPLVQRVDDGYNGVVTAYGQSATGKTYTFGSDGASVNSGCILRSCSALLESLYSDGSIDTRKGHLYISVGELYNEDMRDMLAADTMDKGRGRKICFEAHSHRLKGLSAHVITNMDECVEMIRKGSRRRSVHQDGVLGGSSHLGHLLIKFTLERARTCNERSTVRSTGGGGGGGDVMVRSSLSFVELAGSEWRDLNSARYFQVSGGRIPEDARQISNALSSLSALIHSRKNDMPLRGESKLSTLLHDALAGKVFWSLIITIGPSFDFLHETTTSLLFGKRAMLLENTPLWNHEPAILTVEKLSGSPLKSDFWFSPQPAGICSATPRKKIGGSTLKRGVKTVRQAQSMSPQARRKISFHHQSRVRSSARDHPDLDFSSYVARQLGVEETQADGIDDEDDNIAHALAPEMRNPPEHTEKPDRRNRKLAFEKSAPAHATRLSLSSSFKDGDEHGVSDAMYSGHGGAQNMVNPRQRVVAMDPFTFRLLLEDLLEAHGQVMSVHASMPSSMMLDEMHTRSHVSSFRDILKHLLALPEGAQLMMRMVQKALALLAADASGMSVVKSLDTPQRMDADFAADQVFIPVLQQLLSSDPGESSQVKAVGEDLSVSDVETRGVEAEALILRVLETAFDGKHIQRALHPPAADATDTDTDKDAEKQIASENNVYAAMSDLYTACTCDVMREGGMAAIHSTFPSRNQPEILQRLDSCLRQSQHQAGELHGYRQESIASAALCQSLAEQAIAGRRRASRLTRELERSSKMLRLLGEELLEEKRRSREKLVETERGWQDKMSFHKMALLEEKVNAFEEEKSQQQQFNISNVEDILGESGEKETLGKFDDDEDNSSTTSTHDKTARLKEVFEKIEAEAETMQQRSSGTGESEKIDGNDQMNTSPASQSSADKYARLENMFQQVKAAESKPHNATDADLQGGVNFKSDGKYQETTMSASTALNGDVVRNGEEDQIENTVIRITLGIDFSNAGVVGSGVRLAFEDTLCCDLAYAADLEPENFCVLQMSPGSVIVDTEFLTDDAHLWSGGRRPCDIVADLSVQVLDANSKLMNGTVLCHTQSLAPLSKEESRRIHEQQKDVTKEPEASGWVAFSHNEGSAEVEVAAEKRGEGGGAGERGAEEETGVEKTEKPRMSSLAHMRGAKTNDVSGGVVGGGGKGWMVDFDAESAVAGGSEVVDVTEIEPFVMEITPAKAREVGGVAAAGSSATEDGVSRQVSHGVSSQVSHGVSSQVHASSPQTFEIESSTFQNSPLNPPKVGKGNIRCRPHSRPPPEVDESGGAVGAAGVAACAQPHVDAKREGGRQREAVNEKDLASAKRLISKSIKETGSYWDSCVQYFLRNKSGASIRAAVKSARC